MGADIHGWVEIRDHGSDWWEAAIYIDRIVYRQYGMFASLFGLRNGEHDKITAVGRFRAIAPGRGEPPGSSYFYREDRDNYGGQVGETWVLWSELAAIDWDEEGKQYIEESPPHFVVRSEPGPGRRSERRGDYRIHGWATLFKLMALLGEQFGADNVRLSVWFDQW